jgi:hypothetical protein
MLDCGKRSLSFLSGNDTQSYKSGTMPRGIILNAQRYVEMHITKIEHAYDMHIYLL